MIEPLKIALGEFGVSEKVGKEHDERVLQYFHDIGHKWVLTDETAWCSAFVNWCAKMAGYQHSGKLNARSWLEVGLRAEKPQLGDVVVLWRVARNDWRGHVGFYIRETKTHIYILGGNQGNKVSISAYPKNRLLDYRRLSKID